MKLSLGSFWSCCYWLNGCVAVFALASTATAQPEVDGVILSGRTIPVNTSSREIRAQPVIQLVQTEIYSPESSEPGTIRRTPGLSAFPLQSYLEDDSSSTIAFSRKRNPTSPFISLLDLFTNDWDDSEEEESEDLEFVSTPWTDITPPANRSSLRRRKRY